MLKEKYHIISKQLLRFVVLLLILRLSFIFSGNFVYKNQIFLLVYVATCTFFALRLKDKKNQNINLLLYLFFSSLIPLQVSFSDALSCLISSLSLMLGIKSPVLFSIKSKYGNLKVVKFLLHRCNALFHNDTIHGIQYFDKQNFSYYHKDSHIGKFLTAFITPEKKLNIGVVGLGIGELSLYAHNKNQKISFYEIDEELIKIVTNPNYFSIIKESKADINIISGEARKVMQKESEQQYDVLIIDAYSGHTIPNYLLSYEALKLYSKKIKSNGILILHATGSSFSDNEMAKIIQELNLTAYISHYELQEKNEQKPTQHQGLHYVKTCEHTLWDKINKRLNELLKICGLTLMNMDNFASDWVIIAHDKVDLSLVAKDRSWISLKNNSSQTMLMTDMAIGYRNF
jgi:spermidine synthase